MGHERQQMSDKGSRKGLRERWATDGFVFAKQAALESLFKIKDYHEAADLRGIVVGLDGPIDWLAWADLQDVRLENVDFGSAKFSCSFIRGQFRAVRFAGSEFDTCRFAKAHFVDVDFTRSLLLAPWLEDAVFIGCRFHGARIRGRGKVLSNASGARIKFERCDFRDSTFDRIMMAGVDFIDCHFEGARFMECQVFNWRFKGQAPTQKQFLNCPYRGKNIGLDFLERSPRGPI
ncbi:hypothetical protein LCGC14_2655930 [marine sediment metagenome]|uniref:Pentapeptide repeat protein n=1 Tax=marine sediment metagenome TaxID=412755 RepID=A0A0F9AFQ3_9ZZZZ